MIPISIHTQVLFQQCPPELLCSVLKKTPSFRWLEEGGRAEAASRRLYLRCARDLAQERTEDELSQYYYDLRDCLRARPRGGIFTLPALCGKELLCFPDGHPLFRQGEALAWRELTLALGQDLFTCAALAWRDVEEGCFSRDFSWPAAVRTDSSELRNMVSRGLAENHYHLNGSTQSFALTWGYLMNRPGKARRYFADPLFQDNVHSAAAWGEQDNQMPWEDRIYLAAWLRATLFLRTRGEEEIFLPFPGREKRRLIRERVESVRFLYGARLPRAGGRPACLDYAISGEGFLDPECPTRFLTGERRFLYDCFRLCYQGDFSRREANGFHLYLLLKNALRNELIQNNGRYGFRNFSMYQDRKSLVWGDDPAYWAEANRLAISATLAAAGEGVCRSLELRVMPGRRREELRRNVCLPQRLIRPIDPERGGGTGPEEDRRLFYVLHFAKAPLPMVDREVSGLTIPARHHDLRLTVQRQARMIARALERSPQLCGLIRGIDAASHEVGCRPEVFATAFRFLRGFVPWFSTPGDLPRRWPRLGATYHAGEDFLDLADGLRAVDEAVRFLNLEDGARLGHGLSLGVEPEGYYKLKNRQTVLPAQDLLDNLVWLLFRSLEWGVEMPSALRTRLTQQAESLLRRIYGQDVPGGTLEAYWRGWKLRGDDPELYRDPVLDPDQALGLLWPRLDAHRYGAFRKNNAQGELEDCRKDREVREMVHAYQFSGRVRWEGQRVEAFTADREYTVLLAAVQAAMRERLMDRDICVECNPSSNYLIGSFRRYEKHPIFCFNSRGLDLPECTDRQTQLRVSINTDDQGIFDTSLENEYALLYCALTSRRDRAGKRMVSNDAALDYLDHVRTMGLDMVFPQAEERRLTRLLGRM